ncbi:MAG TPA: SPOR domain-containing protein [Hyphomicrobiaceae bacterium]|nr:SPOR domain-containing protein [Hyphomicrobiaceae bacterium]
MTWDWRRLALAAFAAMAVAAAEPASSQTPTPAKTPTKKKPAKAEPADGDEKGASQKAKKQDPVEAQRAIEAAHKLLEAGKAEQASQALTAVIEGGNLPPAIMAKALLYRGIAYRQQKLTAQAIADLTSALWLKGGLGEADRNDALRQRASAYQEAGLADSGGPIEPAVPGGRTRTASAPEGTSGQSGGGWFNPFSGWFGGSSSTPAQQPAPPPTTASIETERAPPVTKSSGWTSTTEARSAPEAPAHPPAAAKVASHADGKFRIQLGVPTASGMRTQAEAQTLAARVVREHAGVLASREPEIDETVVGSWGSFYRVRIGPFATAQDGQAACGKLKGAGIDCLVVTH